MALLYTEIWWFLFALFTLLVSLIPDKQFAVFVSILGLLSAMPLSPPDSGVAIAIASALIIWTATQALKQNLKEGE